ncbi:amidohydrolase family protein [Lacicoccus qingdaonensis]|uniref:Sodium/glutamate symporter n=1 Tax=Lacicoccus qingdaonensis TaxID=576118 RepID=A0A1G9AWN4_9BACL|nr:amidohydrolase family protein [Salinicoccus qingdaonensis]SDK31637.1 Sodium/glutamate symporter [Salinicoccus qingdaonensis]
MSFMIAFGLASAMLCVGLIIRTKVGFIKRMLVPTSVIAGIVGFFVMNSGLITAIDSEMYIEIVTLLFTVTFISIGLTSNPKSKATASSGRDVAKGSLGMGFTWNILYALTPVVDPDMLHTIWSAVNRITRNGVHIGLEERVSVYDALKAVTINAAYAYFEEDRKGSIKEGKLADLVILDDNPLKVDQMDLRDIKVLETIKEGETIYQADI